MTDKIKHINDVIVGLKDSYKGLEDGLVDFQSFAPYELVEKHPST